MIYSQSEICSEVSHSIADDGGQPSSGITCRSLPSISNTCNGICCTARISDQPTNRELFSQTEKVYGSCINVKKRCLFPSWYKIFAWIHFCSKSSRVYFYFCQEASKSMLTVISTKAEPAVTVIGFSYRK